MRRTGAALVAVSLLAATTPTFAQEAPAAPAGPSTRESRRAAREHYRRGRELQAARAYAEAVAEYEAGYAAFASPDFLFNIGQCYRLMGERAKAVEYYERYLVAEPNGMGAAEAKEHIAELKAAAAPVPAPVEPKPAPPPPTEVPKPSAPEPERSRPDIPSPAPAEPARPRGVWQYTGMSLTGAGLVAGGIAGYYIVRSAQLSKEIDALPPMSEWGPEEKATYAAGERANLNSYVFGVSAGVLVLGGVACYVYGPRPQVSLAVGSDHAMLSLNGRF